MRKVLLFLLVILATALAAAQDIRYIAVDDAPLFAGSGAAEEIARLRITVPVEVLEENDTHARVRVEGWARQEGDALVAPFFTNSRDQIEIASQLDVSRLATGEAGEGGANASLEGWVAKEQLAGERDGMFTQAASTYQRYCSRCHVGYAGPVEALIDRLEPHEWPSIAQRMAMGTRISDADLSLVVHWLQHESQQKNQ